MNKASVLNRKLLIDICCRVCEYDELDSCAKKIETMDNIDENTRL